jgi:hypothetical protein
VSASRDLSVKRRIYLELSARCGLQSISHRFRHDVLPLRDGATSYTHGPRYGGTVVFEEFENDGFVHSGP